MWKSNQVFDRLDANAIEIAANDLTINKPIFFMPSRSFPQTGAITETILGIVDRVTYHNPDNGWSVLRVLPFNNPHQQETVIVHQTKVFAGATMEFQGAWTIHPKFGRQFKAVKTVEKKPATAAALEKYLGSGLIKGVGPKTAKKIVKHFGNKTLDIFEEEIERLTEITGIAQKKLEMISGLDRASGDQGSDDVFAVPRNQHPVCCADLQGIRR